MATGHTIFHSIVTPIHRARLDIILVYFSLALTFIAFYGHVLTPRILTILFVFMSGQIAVFFLNRIFDAAEDSISQKNERVQNTHFYAAASIVLIIASLATLFFISEPVLPVAVLILIGSLYSIPVFSGKRIKNIFVLKNIWAAFGTYAIFAVLPSFYLSSGQSLLVTLFNLIPLLVIAFVYEIFIDIRDMKGDAAASVKTIPNAVGVFRSKMLMLIILAALLLFLTFFFNVLAVASAFLVALAILFVNERRGVWYYHLLFYAQSALILLYIFV